MHKTAEAKLFLCIKLNPNPNSNKAYVHHQNADPLYLLIYSKMSSAYATLASIFMKTVHAVSVLLMRIFTW